jgi:hypothetical protein
MRSGYVLAINGDTFDYASEHSSKCAAPCHPHVFDVVATTYDYLKSTTKTLNPVLEDVVFAPVTRSFGRL